MGRIDSTLSWTVIKVSNECTPLNGCRLDV
jgi:hypothetical protein